MTDNQLLDAYPDCPTAVAFTELFICGGDPGEQTGWDILMSAIPPVTLDGAIYVIRSAMENEELGKAKEALAQTYHPSYRTYIAGKMGMM